MAKKRISVLKKMIVVFDCAKLGKEIAVELTGDNLIGYSDCSGDNSSVAIVVYCECGERHRFSSYDLPIS